MASASPSPKPQNGTHHSSSLPPSASLPLPAAPSSSPAISATDIDGPQAGSVVKDETADEQDPSHSSNMDAFAPVKRSARLASRPRRVVSEPTETETEKSADTTNDRDYQPKEEAAADDLTSFEEQEALESKNDVETELAGLEADGNADLDEAWLKEYLQQREKEIKSKVAKASKPAKQGKPIKTGSQPAGSKPPTSNTVQSDNNKPKPATTPFQPASATELSPTAAHQTETVVASKSESVTVSYLEGGQQVTVQHNIEVVDISAQTATTTNTASSASALPLPPAPSSATMGVVEVDRPEVPEIVLVRSTSKREASFDAEPDPVPKKAKRKKVLRGSDDEDDESLDLDYQEDASRVASERGDSGDDEREESNEEEEEAEEGDDDEEEEDAKPKKKAQHRKKQRPRKKAKSKHDSSEEEDGEGEEKESDAVDSEKGDEDDPEVEEAASGDELGDLLADQDNDLDLDKLRAALANTDSRPPKRQRSAAASSSAADPAPAESADASAGDSGSAADAPPSKRVKAAAPVLATNADGTVDYSQGLPDDFEEEEEDEAEANEDKSDSDSESDSDEESAAASPKKPKAKESEGAVAGDDGVESPSRPQNKRVADSNKYGYFADPNQLSDSDNDSDYCESEPPEQKCSRVGAEYQAEIPPLLPESEQATYQELHLNDEGEPVPQVPAMLLPTKTTRPYNYAEHLSLEARVHLQRLGALPPGVVPFDVPGPDGYDFPEHQMPQLQSPTNSYSHPPVLRISSLESLAIPPSPSGSLEPIRSAPPRSNIARRSGVTHSPNSTPTPSAAGPSPSPPFASPPPLPISPRPTTSGLTIRTSPIDLAPVHTSSLDHKPSSPQSYEALVAPTAEQLTAPPERVRVKVGDQVKTQILGVTSGTVLVQSVDTYDTAPGGASLLNSSLGGLGRSGVPEDTRQHFVGLLFPRHLLQRYALAQQDDIGAALKALAKVAITHLQQPDYSCPN